MSKYNYDFLKEANGSILSIIRLDPISSNDVKEFRKKHNFTQKKMAIIMNVTKKTIEKWEQGTNKVSGTALMLFNIYMKYPDVLYSVYSYRDKTTNGAIEETK